LFNLNLNNVETNKVENHIFRLVEGGVPDLNPRRPDCHRGAVPAAASSPDGFN